MRFILKRKSTGNTLFTEDEKSKDAVLADLKSGGEDVSDYVVYTPQEYREEAQKEAAQQEMERRNPGLSKAFPRTMSVNPDGSTNKAQKIASDVFSAPGRVIGAAIDGISTGSMEETVKSIGETKAGDRQRGTVGGFVQGALRDEMLIPGIMTGSAATRAIPYIPFLGAKAAQMANTPAPTVIGKFLKRDLAIPVVGGAGIGLGVGLERPVLTGEQKIGEDVLFGAASNPAFHNALNLARLGISAGAKGVKTGFQNAIGKKMQATNDIIRFAGKKPSEIVGDIESQYGVNLDDWNPAMQRGGIPHGRTSAYDVAQTAITSRGIPTTQKAEWLGNNSGTSKEALLKATSKKGVAELEADYRSQTKIAEDISEKLSLENLIGEDLNIWKNYLANSETYLSPRSLKAALLKPSIEHGLDPSEFKTISKHLKTLGEHPVMTPKEVELFRQRLGDDLHLNKAKADSKMGRIEQNAINDAYHIARDMNLKAAADEGQSAAAEAYMRNAEALELRDNVLHVLKAAKGDKRDVEIKMASIFKNRGNEESNSIQTQAVFDALEKLDAKLGTDYANRVYNAHLANQLSPSGKQFNVKEYNSHFTGKGYEDSHLKSTIEGKTIKSAFVNIAREKAKDLLRPQTVSVQGRNYIPTTYYGNPFGGGKERDKAIGNLPE